MADKKTEISDGIETIRKGVYGKDVREAIANGLELCYDYAGGHVALEAIDRLEGIVTDSEDAINTLREVAATAGDLVVISDEQPTSPNNKIWVQPMSDTEYKVATYEAYNALWERFNQLNNIYLQGHGGIASIALNNNYSDPTNPLKKQYVITYSDNTTSVFYVYNGAKGDTGLYDRIKSYNQGGIQVYYTTVAADVNGQPVSSSPPASGWSTTLPTINPGEYLWTQTRLTYESNQTTYIYSLCRQGKDGLNGDGAMNSIQLGSDTSTKKSGDAVIPMDTVPTAGHTGYLMSSDAIKNAVDLKCFTVHFNANSAVTSATVNDARITTEYTVANSTIAHGSDVTWTITSGKITVQSTRGIPEMTLMLIKE